MEKLKREIIYGKNSQATKSQLLNFLDFETFIEKFQSSQEPLDEESAKRIRTLWAEATTCIKTFDKIRTLIETKAEVKGKVISA